MTGADAGWANAGTARSGAALADVDAVLEALSRLFAGAGYRPLSPPHLFPAEVLLDLYGEDVRSRAFLFPGVQGEELCLRPDFTVPVAVAHGETGWERAAKYAYRGPVFRRQERSAGRPVEYLQAGIENIGAPDPAGAEAQVLALTLRGLETVGAEDWQVTTGDLGIVFALLDALAMPKWLRRRLRRHVWRPHRFAALIEDAVAQDQPPQSPRRTAILNAARESADALTAAAQAEGEIIGARDIAEMAERAIDLSGPAAAPPHLAPEQGALIEAVLSLEGPSGDVLARLRNLTAGAGVDLTIAIDSVERRLDACSRAGLDGEMLRFDASFGRALEYYDGFVFEVTARNRPSLPPLAGGGRYDSLMLELGAGRGVPAVGAMIRPEAAMAARQIDDVSPPPAAPALAPAALPRRQAGAMAAGDLVLALPSKGRLQEETIAWFAARGITIRRSGAGRAYAAEADGVPGLGVAMLSAGEIPAALDAGRVHLGVTGEDMIQERLIPWERRVRLLARMGFGHADLVVAVPGWWADVETMADLDEAAERYRARHGHAMRIATKYHWLTRQFFRRCGVADYRIVDSQGATEAAPKNQSAEALVDITSSGETLRANHLRVLSDGLILRSQACLFASRGIKWSAAARGVASRLSSRLGVPVQS